MSTLFLIFFYNLINSIDNPAAYVRINPITKTFLRDAGHQSGGICMDKFRRISCLVGAALLVLLYLVAIVAACIQSDAWAGYFKVAIYGTIVIPCFLYGMQLIYRVLKKQKKQ